MKFVLVLSVLALAGCAGNNRSYATQAISYQELESIKLTNADCPYIDSKINFFETQLRLKGILYADPATLNNQDRLYNMQARTNIWALRVGCANPDRYTK
jgi:hypothetical protein